MSDDSAAGGRLDGMADEPRTFDVRTYGALPDSDPAADPRANGAALRRALAAANAAGGATILTHAGYTYDLREPGQLANCTIELDESYAPKPPGDTP